MNYEIVNLTEKKVEGLKIRTANSNPNAGNEIGGLWIKFHEQEIFSSIQNKVNEKSIGIYTNYSDNKDEYDCIVCCEKSNLDTCLEQTITSTIPAGKYAKFVVTGNMQTAVIDFWMKLWQMELDRKFECDFEEYQNSDFDNAIVHVYISIN